MDEIETRQCWSETAWHGIKQYSMGMTLDNMAERPHTNTERERERETERDRKSERGAHVSITM